MKQILTILCFSLLAYTSRAQKDSAFTLVRTYLGDVAGAAIDHMDNLYIISSKGQIRKLDAKGDSVAVYNQVRLSGQLHTIDVSNPLKILLFYKDFSTVVVLDRFLAPVATLDLRRYNILQPGAIGLSYDNNIWVFDQWDNKLKRIDEQGTMLMETPDLRSVFPQGLNPQRILSDNGLVYLADSAAGIHIFDNYGSFKRSVPLVKWQSITVYQNNIIGIYGDRISVYHTTNFTQKDSSIPFFKPYFHSFVSPGKLVGYGPRALNVYQYRY